jgi:hypothetical protein
MAEPKGSLLQRFASWLLADPDAGEVDAFSRSDDEKLLREQVEAAKKDWLAARSYFDSLSDPDLVDYAVYSIEAAERKYMYLLKQLKSEQQRSM